MILALALAKMKKCFKVMPIFKNFINFVIFFDTMDILVGQNIMKLESLDYITHIYSILFFFKMDLELSLLEMIIR